LKATQQGKVLLLQKGVLLIKSPVNKHTELENPPSFIPNAHLPLTLIEQLSGSQSSGLAKKKKGYVGQRTLGWEEQRFS
jgi:hypothetical protein